jgi:hypothetical protein
VHAKTLAIGSGRQCWQLIAANLKKSTHLQYLTTSTAACGDGRAP